MSLRNTLQVSRVRGLPLSQQGCFCEAEFWLLFFRPFWQVFEISFIRGSGVEGQGKEMTHNPAWKPQVKTKQNKSLLCIMSWGEAWALGVRLNSRGDSNTQDNLQAPVFMVLYLVSSNVLEI